MFCRAWLALADIYTWPHVLHFDSWDHLCQLLVGLIIIILFVIRSIEYRVNDIC